MTDRSPPYGVILAAGKGRRMVEAGLDLPKAALPICNRPLIVHHLATLGRLGIRTVIVVVGGNAWAIREIIAAHRIPGIAVHFVEQSKPEGIAAALALARPHVKGPFLVILGDTYFAPLDLEGMFVALDRQGGGGMIAVKHEPDLAAIQRNYSVQVAADGAVIRVVEKPKNPATDLKGLGIYAFDDSIFRAIEQTSRSGLRGEYEITDSIQQLIHMGSPVGAMEAVADDINITTPRDLLAANLIELRRRGLQRIVGDGCRFPNGVEIDRSVIGANVTVTHPIQIRGSLVFDEVEINGTAGLTGVIALHGKQIVCGDTRQSEC